VLLSGGEGGADNALSANLRIVGQGLRKFPERQSHAGLEQGTEEEDKGVMVEEVEKGWERSSRKEVQWKGK
jgi:predicted transcriptional regulator